MLLLHRVRLESQALGSFTLDFFFFKFILYLCMYERIDLNLFIFYGDIG